MPTTTVRGGQITNATIQRQDLDVSTVGQAVVAKILQGTNVTLSSTGGDSGTGDVTISVPTGGVGPQGPAGTPGSKWWNGAGAPPDPIPGAVAGDYYLNTTNGDVYQVS
jgi:hypothetical protein